MVKDSVQFAHRRKGAMFEEVNTEEKWEQSRSHDCCGVFAEKSDGKRGGLGGVMGEASAGPKQFEVTTNKGNAQ